jgi:hypothetical protein
MVGGTLVTACGFTPEARATTISDVAADFSATNNPNGVWQYGSSFGVSPDPAVRDGVDTWRGNGPPGPEDGNPGEYHNGTAFPIVLGNTAHLDAGQFALHPGPNGEYAVVRYVAPDAGFAAITSAFTSQDEVGTTTDVHVLLNGQSLFDGLVEDFSLGTGVAFNSQFLVAAGDEIDFAVGVGSNQWYSNDTTGLAATIALAPVPEPGSALLLGFGLGGLGLGRRRRRSRHGVQA